MLVPLLLYADPAEDLEYVQDSKVPAHAGPVQQITATHAITLIAF